MPEERPVRRRRRAVGPADARPVEPAHLPLEDERGARTGHDAEHFRRERPPHHDRA